MKKMLLLMMQVAIVLSLLATPAFTQNERYEIQDRMGPLYYYTTTGMEELPVSYPLSPGEVILSGPRASFTLICNHCKFKMYAGADTILALHEHSIQVFSGAVLFHSFEESHYPLQLEIPNGTFLTTHPASFVVSGYTLENQDTETTETTENFQCMVMEGLVKYFHSNTDQTEFRLTPDTENRIRFSQPTDGDLGITQQTLPIPELNDSWLREAQAIYMKGESLHQLTETIPRDIPITAGNLRLRSSERLSNQELETMLQPVLFVRIQPIWHSPTRRIYHFPIDNRE